MKVERKYLIATLIGAISLTGAYMYLQVKKILNYTLNFVGARNVSISATGVTADFVYEYQNKANIDVTLATQEYEIFINGVYFTTLRNDNPTLLKGGQNSSIVVKMDLNYKELGKVLKTNYLTLVALPQNVKILTKMKWKAKYGIFKVPITYDWEVTLKEVMGWLPKK
jgi:LEA14-like dessication related protein